MQRAWAGCQARVARSAGALKMFCGEGLAARLHSTRLACQLGQKPDPWPCSSSHLLPRQAGPAGGGPPGGRWPAPKRPGPPSACAVAWEGVVPGKPNPVVSGTRKSFGGLKSMGLGRLRDHQFKQEGNHLAELFGYPPSNCTNWPSLARLRAWQLGKHTASQGCLVNKQRTMPLTQADIGRGHTTSIAGVPVPMPNASQPHTA